MVIVVLVVVVVVFDVVVVFSPGMLPTLQIAITPIQTPITNNEITANQILFFITLHFPRTTPAGFYREIIPYYQKNVKY